MCADCIEVYSLICHVDNKSFLKGIIYVPGHWCFEVMINLTVLTYGASLSLGEDGEHTVGIILSGRLGTTSLSCGLFTLMMVVLLP